MVEVLKTLINALLNAVESLSESLEGIEEKVRNTSLAGILVPLFW